MKEKIVKGFRRTGVFAAMVAVLLLAGIMAVLLFGIQAVIGLLDKILR